MQNICTEPIQGRHGFGVCRTCEPQPINYMRFLKVLIEMSPHKAPCTVPPFDSSLACLSCTIVARKGSWACGIKLEREGKGNEKLGHTNQVLSLHSCLFLPPHTHPPKPALFKQDTKLGMRLDVTCSSSSSKETLQSSPVNSPQCCSRDAWGRAISV